MPNPPTQLLAPLQKTLKEKEAVSGRKWLGVLDAEGNLNHVPQRVDFVVNYTHLFHGVFDYVVNEKRLSHAGVRVLTRVMKLFSSGSLIGVSQTELAKSLGMDRGTVNKAWNELRQLGVFVESTDKVSEHININLAYMGSPKDLFTGEGQQQMLADLKRLQDSGIPAKRVVGRDGYRPERQRKVAKRDAGSVE